MIIFLPVSRPESCFSRWLKSSSSAANNLLLNPTNAPERRRLHKNKAPAIMHIQRLISFHRPAMAFAVKFCIQFERRAPGKIFARNNLLRHVIKQSRAGV